MNVACCEILCSEDGVSEIFSVDASALLICCGNINWGWASVMSQMDVQYISVIELLTDF